jgi:hypothetical protein
MKAIFRSAGLILIFMLGYAVTANAQAGKKADNDTEEWRYDIECVSVGASGSYQIKVWSYSKKSTVAINQAKKNAVHGIIFKGFTGTGAGCTQKPLASSPDIEQQKSEFFKDFFADGGKYMQFVTSASEGEIAAGDVVKVGKEYKIGVVVSVYKDQLRKDLEAAGIIKGLSDGF